MAHALAAVHETAPAGKTPGPPAGLVQGAGGSCPDCTDPPTPELLLPALLQETGRDERRVNDTGPVPDHRGPLARDTPGKTHAWREVLVVRLNDGIANR